MRIVDRKTFLALPPGILYHPATSYDFGNFAIKYQNLGEDFVVQDFPYFEDCEDFIEACERLEKGESLTLDVDFAGRDGLYEKDRKFLIYEEKDIRILIEKLQTLLK